MPENQHEELALARKLILFSLQGALLHQKLLHCLKRHAVKSPCSWTCNAIACPTRFCGGGFPMFHDRFVKVMLLVIAMLLSANLLRTRSGGGAAGLTFVSSAQAQRMGNANSPAPEPRRYEMKRVDGLQVEDLKDVVSLGDGKTFVVSNTKGFMVFTVETHR